MKISSGKVWLTRSQTAMWPQPGSPDPETKRSARSLLNDKDDTGPQSYKN